MGLDSRVHAVPSQCSIKAPPSAEPTAQALLGEVAATPARPAPGTGPESRAQAGASPGSGLGTCVHAVPSQCSITVCPDPGQQLRPWSCQSPTAQALPGEVAATPNSSLMAKPPGFGLGTCIQVVPFQRTIQVRCA